MLVSAVRDLDELGALQASVDMVSDGASSHTVFQALLEGLREVDARYESGMYFIADLMMAGHILKSVMNKSLAMGGAGESGSMGRAVMATVRDDIHELGKNVIADVLRHNGFEVVDLGPDVPEGRILDAVRDGVDVRGGIPTGGTPDILILSGMMPESPDRMAGTIDALSDAGLRQRVRVIVGGRFVTPELAVAMGADACSGGVLDCLKLCLEFRARKRLRRSRLAPGAG